jgi:hypothetical protein
MKRIQTQDLCMSFSDWNVKAQRRRQHRPVRDVLQLSSVMAPRRHRRLGRMPLMPRKKRCAVAPYRKIVTVCVNHAFSISYSSEQYWTRTSDLTGVMTF